MELYQPTQNVRTVRPFQTPVLKKIKAEIMFGNPCLGCQGVGICKVLSYGQRTDCKCPKVVGWIGVTVEGRIRINFLKSSMEKPFIRKHFGWLLFQVYEAYSLPEGIANRLGLSELTVRPGIYTVWETNRYLTVDF